MDFFYENATSSRTFVNRGKRRKGPSPLLPELLSLTHVHVLRRGFLPGRGGTAGLLSRRGRGAYLLQHA
jgi:hypothetical protein